MRVKIKKIKTDKIWITRNTFYHNWFLVTWVNRFSNLKKATSKERVKKSHITGINKTKIKNEVKIVIGRPSERRFIWGAAFDKIPIVTEIKNKVPTKGREIIMASKNKSVRPVNKKVIKLWC